MKPVPDVNYVFGGTLNLAQSQCVMVSCTITATTSRAQLIFHGSRSPARITSPSACHNVPMTFIEIEGHLRCLKVLNGQ